MHKPLIVQKTAAAFTMERTIIDFYLSSFSLIMCTYKVNSVLLLSFCAVCTFSYYSPAIRSSRWLKRNAFLIVKIFKMHRTLHIVQAIYTHFPFAGLLGDDFDMEKLFLFACREIKIASFELHTVSQLICLFAHFQSLSFTVALLPARFQSALLLLRYSCSHNSF